MPTTTSILWTALPNGGPSGAYKCSIYVSPRLEGGGPTGLLSDYDLGNWTATVQNLLALGSPFQFELGPGGPVLATEVDPAYFAELDPALWDAIFPPTNTKVTERVFQDHSKRWIRSFRVGLVEDYIQGLYDDVATNHVDGFPDLKAPTGPVIDLLTLTGRALGPIMQALPGPREVDDIGRPLPKQYDPVPLRGPAIHPDQATESELTTLAGTLGLTHIPISEMFRAERFYRRGNHLPYQSKDVPYNADAVPDPPKEPEFDFHQALAGLGDHPNVLRKLGLIVDLIVPYAEADLSLYSELQLVPPALAPIASITPWTKYQVQGATGFRPAPLPSGDLRSGMLRLDSKSNHRVLQTDPDGNALKVYDYAANMQRQRTRLLSERAKRPEAKSSQAPEETSLPALRSGGFQVVRDQRDAKSWYHLSRQATHESDLESSVLYADDVLRGFRVDVDYRGNWYSLCRRHGDVELAGTVVPQPGPNEGYHKAESATSDAEDVPEGEQQPDLYLHETMFTWRNWSMVAPVPGKTIVPKREPDKRQTESVEHSENVPGAGFEIAANYKPEPLSLPPLRFGEEYRFRARAVDLAGNSLSPPPSKSFPGPDPDQPNQDWASPPITYLRYDPVPAPMALVTDKVTWGESMEQVVIRTRADGDAADPLPGEVGYAEEDIFIPKNTRWIAPPKADVGTAEAHGTFDALFKTPAAAFDILKRESGSFDDLGVTGTEVIDVDGNVIDTTVTDGFWDLFQKGDPLPDGMYFVHTQDPLELPYLPDPLAHGATFWPLDGSKSWAHRKYASSGWPDAEPFRLILAEGTAAKVDLSGPDGFVRLPPGEMLTVRYASAVVGPDSPDEGELALMGRWHSMGQPGRDGTKAHFWQHWMLTPFRTFVFVHAVERPLKEPKAIALQFDKQRGETFVTLVEGAGQTHSPSTGEVELRGRWVDWVDDPTATEDQDDPHPESKDSHVWDRRIDYGEDPFYVPSRGEPGPKHEFGDTKHRWVYYRFIGTTRYREYFPHSLVDYETVEPHPHDPELTQKKKLTTRAGPEYVEDGEPVNIPSSARPVPPDVLYVLPTFKWVDTASGRRRLGRGLRIYLKRGWFSSGVDERLGVVLFPSGPMLPSVAEKLRKYVSQWGNDPIFNRDLTVGLTPAQFTWDPAFPDTAPRELGEDLLVAETENTSQPLFVQVQGFEPLFDTERKLWYVDLELLPTDHYYTFIRFGLCRYQPYSLPNCEISRTVRTEFAQLLADRSASLTQRDNGTIDVTLAGPSALSELGEQLPVRATGVPITGGDGIGTTRQAAEGQPGPGPTPPGDIILPPILTPDPSVGRAHKVVAQVESRPIGFSDDPHIGWEEIASTELASHTAFGTPGIVYWKGAVPWPIDNLPEGHEFRLSLREYETYQTDEDVADEITSTSASGKWVKHRLVYVDTFPLTLEPGGLTGG